MKIQSIETENYTFDMGGRMSYGVIQDIKQHKPVNGDNYFKVIFNRAEIYVFNVDLVVFVEDDFEF